MTVAPMTPDDNQSRPALAEDEPGIARAIIDYRSKDVEIGGTASALQVHRHLPALDGLRGIAIVLVLLRHFTPLGVASSFVGGVGKAVASVGGVGVDLFFVLSGFLITGILLDAKGTPHFFRNFYARRTLRIFPLYYGVLFVCFVIVPLFHPFSAAEQKVAHEQGWLWLYGTNIREGMHGVEYPFTGGWLAMDHFWSLAVEEHFYLVWPLAVFLLSRRAMIAACAVAIGGALAIRLWLHLINDRSMAYFHWTPCRMDALALGGLVALVARSPSGAAWLPKVAVGVLPAALVATAASWRTDWGEYVFRGSLLGLMFAALLVLVVSAAARNPLSIVCRARPMRLMGKYSYAIYVLHPLLMTTVLQYVAYPKLVARMHSGVAGVSAFLVIAFAVSIGAAWLSWHLYEKHFLRLKRYFEYRARS